MTIATRLREYLSEHQIPYKMLNHGHSNSSLHSAYAANIPLTNLAKGVILEDHEGRHLMAVLPADMKLNLSAINDEMHASYHLVKEREVYKLFNDCENGAIPPVGSAYYMSMICDQALTTLDDIYLEAGDHKTLLQLDKEAFNELISQSKCISFSSQVFH